MRLLYASTVRVGSGTGDTEHVMHVSRELARRGVEVHLVAVVPGSTNPHVDPDSGVWVHPVVPKRAGAVGLVAAVAAEARRLAVELRPDLTYVRPFPLDWIFLLRHLRRAGLPYVCELNTVIGSEYRAKGEPLKGRIYEWFYAISIRNAAGLLCVTAEIQAWALRLAGRQIPSRVVGNGVDMTRTRPADSGKRTAVRARLNVAEDALVLLMAGFASPWHGADRAIQMLAYLGPDVSLWLAGADSPQVRARAESQARDLGVDARLRVLPRLDEEDLAEVVAASDIGVGPLALDRKSMTQAQPIKVRLYLASGLPVLYSHEDPMLNPDLPFISRASSSSPADLAAGVERLRGQRRDQGEIRAFAEERLSWSAIAADTQAFLEEIVVGRAQ